MLVQIIIQSLFGFSIFILGMKLMELALHKLGGTSLKSWLQTYTRTPIHGLVLGTGTTALLQSSTAVTVITIGLVNSRLLPFYRSLGIILGTNIGTCITTELLSLEIHKLASPILISSMIAWLATLLCKEFSIIPMFSAWTGWNTIRSVSVATCGFSILLFGLTYMQSLAPTIERTNLFGSFIESASQSLWWGVLAGIVVTALVHSGTAVIGMIMAMASMDVMPIELSLAIVLGVNVGTCATGIMASIGGSKAGKYVALSHLLLNVGGLLLFYPFIEQLSQLTVALSHNLPSQIAHFQTIYNVLCSLIALPICYMSWLKSLDNSL